MPAFTEEHISKHTVDELYSLVVDIESYPEFLPWCSGASVVEREDKKIIADLDISFAIFHESYRSCVNLIPPAEGKAMVDVSLISGPFKRLENHWKFEEFEGGTKMYFYVDFEFKSALLDSLAGSVFSMACQKMVNAFEGRAEAIYGTK